MRQSVAELSEKASGDQQFLQVATNYRGRNDFDVASPVSELVESEFVPFLPMLRYKTTGLRKREVWEKTWELQRKEATRQLGQKRQRQFGQGKERLTILKEDDEHLDGFEEYMP